MRAALLVALAACSSPSSPPAKTPPPPVVAAGAKGHVETKTWHSQALGVDKHVVVYLPAAYDADTAKRWPVFYYLNGLGGDETNWVEHGHLDQAADALALGAIVVMPDGDNNFYIDSAMPENYDACMKDGTGLLDPSKSKPWTCVKASKYETYIVDDLVKWTDATYRTVPKREARAIAGLSMGGYGALMIGMRHSDVFAAAASHSGVDALLYSGPYPYVDTKSVQLTDDVVNWGRAIGPVGDWIRALYGPDVANWRDHDPASLAAKLTPGQIALYLDAGTEDDLLLNNGAMYLHDLLLAKHYDHAWYLGPGHHAFTFWAERVGKSLAFLRDHTNS